MHHFSIKMNFWQKFVLQNKCKKAIFQPLSLYFFWHFKFSCIFPKIWLKFIWTHDASFAKFIFLHLCLFCAYVPFLEKMFLFFKKCFYFSKNVFIFQKMFQKIFQNFFNFWVYFSHDNLIWKNTYNCNYSQNYNNLFQLVPYFAFVLFCMHFQIWKRQIWYKLYRILTF